MKDEIAVGLIGYGMAGRVFHAPVIHSVPDLRLKKIVERHGNHSKEKYPSVEIVRDVAELLRDNEIELIVVATPNSSHFEFARQSLIAGKHVVVDKPFTNSSAEAQELIDLAKAQNRIITVHHNRRWDGDFLTVRKLIDGIVLGRLAEYESHFDRFRSQVRSGAWREEEGEGSGIIFDLGSHLIDQAQVLFGLPGTITADVRVQRDMAKAVDNFELILDYDDLKVTLKATMLAREPGPRFLLYGTEGSYVKYGLDPQEEALKQGHTPLETGWGEEPKDLWGRLNTQFGELHVEGVVETLPGCYQAFYQNVADAIRGRAELAVKPEEARDTIRIIELAMQSSEEKRTLAWTEPPK
jgi:scyllo-inositol 2-dehydrogenase (NADP+)